MKKTALVLVALAIVVAVLWVAWRADDQARGTLVGGEPLATDATSSTAGQRADPDAPAPMARTEIASDQRPIDIRMEPRTFPAERGTGVVFGTVVDADGAPVVDAAVEARPDAGNAPPGLAIDDDRLGSQQTRTDAAGGFRFDHVAEGPTRISAHHRDQTAAALAIVSPDRDAGPVAMQLTATPANGDDLQVTVVDAAGVPVADAEVQLFAWPLRTRDPDAAERSRREPLGSGRTDAAGVVAMRGLGAGSGVVFATARDGRVGQAPLASDRDGPRTVRVAVAAAGAVRGRLLGIAAAQLAQATLSLHALNAFHPYYCCGGRCIDVALTGDTFAVEGLAPGQYGITLDAPLAAAHGARLVTTAARWGTEPMANSIEMPTLDVAAGTVTETTLQLVAGGAIRGTVTVDGRPVAGVRARAVLAPRTSNFPDGFVLRGAHVWRLDGPYENAGTNPISHRDVRTDARGRYELLGLAPGLWRVEVAAPSLSFDRRLDVEVKDGAGVELQHELARAGVLQVAVLSATYLGVIREGQKDPVMLAITRDDFATFPGLAPGRYVVARFHSDSAVEPVPVGTGEVFAGRTTWLDLRAASVRTVITGHVVSGATPVAGARVRLYPALAVTGADGAFRLELGHSVRFGGNMGADLQVISGGFNWSLVPEAAGAVTSLVCVLQLGDAGVDVELVDASGAPATARLDVRWLAPEPRPGSVALLKSASANVSTRRDGATRLGPFPPGTLQGSVAWDDGLQMPFTTAVPRDGPLRITRPATGSLRVRVTKGGKPAVKAQVWVSTWIGEGPAPERAEDFQTTIATVGARAGNDGEATLVVVAGELLVHVSDDRFGDTATPRRLRVEPGATVPIEVDLP